MDDDFMTRRAAQIEEWILAIFDEEWDAAHDDR